MEDKHYFGDFRHCTFASKDWVKCRLCLKHSQKNEWRIKRRSRITRVRSGGHGDKEGERGEKERERELDRLTGIWKQKSVASFFVRTTR